MALITTFFTRMENRRSPSAMKMEKLVQLIKGVHKLMEANKDVKKFATGMRKEFGVEDNGLSELLEMGNAK